MIHHSHGSLSLGPDTAVTHIHMHVNMQSYARGQTRTFISGGSSQALVYLEITALEMIQKNLQQCLRLFFNKHNDPVFIGDMIFLTPHVKNANCPNSKHILWVLHFFSSVL